MTIPRTRIDFIPPAQPNEPAPRYVFQVVEIGGEEEHCYYEDEDAGGFVSMFGLKGGDWDWGEREEGREGMGGWGGEGEVQITSE